MKFIFQVRMKPGQAPERYADAWVRASRIIQTAPGARGTRLHRKIGEPDTLLAIASWDSKACRDAGESRQDPIVQEIIRSAAPFVDITVIGAFEEPEWVVLPPADPARGDAPPHS